MSTNTVKVKLGYYVYDTENPHGQVSDYTRQYNITDVTDAALNPASIKAAVDNLNNNLESDENLEIFFVGEDGGYCRGVLEVISESVTETQITISGGEG